MEGFLTEYHKRKDLHYHLVVGEGEWMPHDFGHPDSLEVNIIYDNHMDAYKAFISQIKGFGVKISEKDVQEGRDAWKEICEEVKIQHVLEVITYLGLGYQEVGIPIELIACNGCVPYGMN
jgi:hypothetical protein